MLSAYLALFTGGCALTGILVLAAYAWQIGTLRVFAVGLLLALAVDAVGAVIGFLFGVPRYRQVIIDQDSSGQSRSGSSTTQRAYTPSNSLEQVSDWLTKLLLGAGLVQLGN
jgi:hypothetical protein